mmetsp:Transcript_6451/g.11855  ORF Transcript_6451/g.11855 Transcript_6451/m.11855 type:complete len:124 (+) Transcript_6451:85-456(+)
MVVRSQQLTSSHNVEVTNENYDPILLKSVAAWNNKQIPLQLKSYYDAISPGIAPGSSKVGMQVVRGEKVVITSPSRGAVHVSSGFSGSVPSGQSSLQMVGFGLFASPWQISEVPPVSQFCEGF